MRKHTKSTDIRALVIALVVIASSCLGAGIALAAPGPDINTDVACGGVLNGGTPNDPIIKTVTSPNDDPATPGVIEAFPGDTLTYVVTWTPNNNPKSDVEDCFVVDGSEADKDGNPTLNLLLATLSVSGTGLNTLLGTDLGFLVELDTNPGTYTYTATIPNNALLIGHSVTNRAKVTASKESKSNFVPVSVVAPPAPPVIPNQDPTVSCPSASVSGLTVDFTAAASDSDGSIVSYGWDFDGNGTIDQTTPGNTVQHTYASGGTYTVRVTVTDDDGATATNTGPCAVTVAAPAPPVIPNQDPTVSCPSASVSGLTVDFTAAASDSDGSIVSYGWDFDGNGTIDQTTPGNTVQHTYASGGTYTVRVTVTDDDGATATNTGPCAVTVAAPAPPVIPNQGPSVSCPSAAINGFDVTFTANASDPDGSIASYEWDFDGDGTFDATTAIGTALHTFGSSGVYEVLVRVTDDDGAAATNGDDCSVTIAAQSGGTTPPPPAPPAPAPPAPTPPAPAVVLGEKRTLPRTGVDTAPLAWIASALLLAGLMLRTARPRPIRMVFAGRGLVAQAVAQYGLMLMANARQVRRYAHRRM